MLDGIGSVFARIMKDRWQVVAEQIQKGEGCANIIFAARQLVEKTREHDDSLFVLFVDLRKANDF